MMPETHPNLDVPSVFDSEPVVTTFKESLAKTPTKGGLLKIGHGYGAHRNAGLGEAAYQNVKHTNLDNTSLLHSLYS